MQSSYSLLVHNLTRLSQAQSSRNIQAEQWLENQTSNNPQVHFLMRQAILDPTVPHNARVMCSTALNNHLLNMLHEYPLNQIFAFARQIIRDPSYPEEHFKLLERFFAEFINRVQENYAQQWLLLFKELLQQKLNTRAFFILAVFSIAEVKDSDFIYFIHMAIPWSVESIMNMVNINGSLCLLEWGKAMCQVLTKLLQKHIFIENLQTIASNGEICKLILMVYELQTSLEYGYLSVASGLTELNILKGSFCQLHSLILKGFHLFAKSLNETPHFALISESMARLSTSLLLVAKDYDKYNEQLQCSDFTRNIVKVFSFAITNTACAQLFFCFAQKLINQAIFPAFLFTQVEIESFQENSQEFKQLIQDLFEKHQSSTLKSECAELLQSIADSIDGTTTYCITTALNSLKTNLKIIERIDRFPLLSNSQSILVLGILGCCYSQRPDAAQMVGAFLSQNSQVILKSLSPIELALLYTCLGYIEGDIFPNNDDGYVYLKHSSICRVHPTTELTALTFLSGHMQKVSSEEILKILLERTQNCGYGLIWTVIQDFIKNKISLITQETAIQIVNVILKHIEKQFQMPQPSSLHTIMQCLNNIRQMLQSKKKFLEGKPALEAAIWRIFDMLKLSGSKNIDDVINLLNEFVRATTNVDKRFFSLFPVLDERLKEDENLYIDIFPFINTLILKANFEGATDQLLKVLQWCLKPLGFENFKEPERAQSLLLLQLFLDKYIHLLLPNVIIQTMSILGLYRGKVTQPPAQFRLYTTLLWFYNASSINVPKLEILKPILSIDYSAPYYFEKYTKKLIVVLLSKILFAETQLQVLTLVMDGIIKVLSNWKTKPEPRTKKNKTKKSKEYSKQKYVDSVDRLSSQYKKLDVFGYFANIISNMKTANPTVSSQIIGGLPEESRNNLRNLLGMRQFAKEKEARRIVKIKGAKDSVELKQTSLVENKMQNEGMEGQEIIEKDEEAMDEESDNPKVRITKKRELKKKAKNKKCLTTIG